MSTSYTKRLWDCFFSYLYNSRFLKCSKSWHIILLQFLNKPGSIIVMHFTSTAHSENVNIKETSIDICFNKVPYVKYVGGGPEGFYGGHEIF